MNKKIIIIISIVIVILLMCIVGYFLLNKTFNNVPDVKNEGDNLETNTPTVNAKGKKSLVIYFSVPETNNPENMTIEEENSTVLVDGEVLGNTQYIAMLISENTKSDLYRIEPKIPYTTNHTDLIEQAKQEQNQNTRPEIKSEITNFDEYDIIYIGYPIWWNDMPQIIYTLLDSYDFSGKTVIPFSTHGGSGISGTLTTIKEKLTNSKVIENMLSLSRDSMETAPEKVQIWLKAINVIK